MGYLDADTITVDAVLTKQGRRILSDPTGGGSLTPVAFVITDTGIDYNNWNADHPSGSAYYGEVIEALPQQEALPQAEYFIRDQLVTLPAGTTAMPVVDLGAVSDPYIFQANNPEQPPLSISPTTLNYGQAVGQASTEASYIIVIPDTSVIDLISSGTFSNMSGVAQQFINVQEIPQGGMYTVTSPNLPMQLSPMGTDTQRTLQITIIGGETGAYTTLKVTIPANIVDQTVKQIASGKEK